MNQEKIGKFLLENRKKQNLTQNELAKKLKVSNHTISNWENGKSMPNYDLLIPLTKELNVSISEIITGEYDSNNEEPNKVVERVIYLLKQIDKDKKKKYMNIGIVLIIIGFLLKIISMIFIEFWQPYDNYYVVLSYIITIVGTSYLFHQDKVKNMLIKTFCGAIISLMLFLSIDIAETVIFDVPPRYFNVDEMYYELRYYRTPFYDIYTCDYESRKQLYPTLYPDTEYKVVFKTKNYDMENLQKKYCKKDEALK